MCRRAAWRKDILIKSFRINRRVMRQLLSGSKLFELFLNRSPREFAFWVFTSSSLSSASRGRGVYLLLLIKRYHDKSKQSSKREIWIEEILTDIISLKRAYVILVRNISDLFAIRYILPDAISISRWWRSSALNRNLLIEGRTLEADWRSRLEKERERNT